jgi:hypothetical protein
VAYVPPKITDSADATKERIKKLNRAIESAKERVSRKEMPEKDRKELSAKRSAARMEKISRESEGDKKQRLKREADWKKNHGDRKFEAQCNTFNAPCPPPRKSNDTAATIRAQRKTSRDAKANRFAFAKKRAPPSGTIFPWDKEWVDDPKRYEKKPFPVKGPFHSYKRCTWRSTLPGKTNGKRCACYARQGGYCDAHGGLGRRLCGHDDCDNIAQKGGMCRRHGTKVEKCSQEGCIFYATKGGFCPVHSRPKCSQEGCERDALKNFGGVSWKHREEPEGEVVQVGLHAWSYRKYDNVGKEVLLPIGPVPPFEHHLMQLDQIARGGNRMVDAVPQGGEHRVVDSSSYVVAVLDRGWRDDNFVAEYQSKNAHCKAVN